ncbi:MAG TPA: hypothetical protein VH062_15510 [Polyangiaceae bacterium]|nr:hypothetical protein [Polyangiaceae bacterium]
MGNTGGGSESGGGGSSGIGGASDGGKAVQCSPITSPSGADTGDSRSRDPGESGALSWVHHMHVFVLRSAV